MGNPFILIRVKLFKDTIALSWYSWTSFTDFLNNIGFIFYFLVLSHKRGVCFFLDQTNVPIVID